MNEDLQTPCNVENPISADHAQSWESGGVAHEGVPAQDSCISGTQCVPQFNQVNSSFVSQQPPGNITSASSSFSSPIYIHEQPITIVEYRDHVAAGLLAIFLGVFGVHKFFLGYTNAGFITLAVSIVGGALTLGLAALVMWVISIAEGIIYMSKSQFEFERYYIYNKQPWF
ncbi:MAG: TM2 domain-containing protein [Eggerthellaceae bacterium]|nr:TM2 domain-containing protein [Eggerthellaceae bacterium]